mgnify:FL=1
MAVYSSSRCGHCGHVWRSMRVGSDLTFGPTYIRCRQCKKINKSGLHLYRDFNWFGKLLFITGRILLLLGIGAALLYFGYLAASDLYYFEITQRKLKFQVNPNNYGIWELVVGHVVFVLLSLLGVFRVFKFFYTPFEVRELTKKADANGGYLWNDEWY